MNTGKAATRAWYRKQKQNAACICCGFSHPAVIEYHHRDPATKSDTLSNMVRHGAELTACQEELAKCDPLCKNCHAIMHWDENAGHYSQYGDAMLNPQRLTQSWTMSRV